MQYLQTNMCIDLKPLVHSRTLSLFVHDEESTDIFGYIIKCDTNLTAGPVLLTGWTVLSMTHDKSNFSKMSPR